MFDLPAIFKILAIFTAVLLATRVKVHLGLALVVGGVMLSMWSGAGPLVTLESTVGSLCDLEFLLLMLITVLIIELGRYITAGENADEIVGAVRRWGGKHGALYTLMGLPAVIGLIPMPGGALFSAPFVQQTGLHIDGNSEWKTSVNYWFRHIWEYWWPLYPGVIMAMWLFDMMPTWQFFCVQFVFTPAAACAGYYFLMRKHVDELAEVKVAATGSNRRALFLMLPIATVLVFAIGLPIIVKALHGEQEGGQLVRLGSVLAGLLVALSIAAVDDLRHGRRKFFSSFLKWHAWSVMLSLSGVLVFKYLLQESGLLPVAAQELANSGMPVLIVVAAMPFIAGLVTGICVGFAGTAFPLVVALVGMGSMTPASALVLAYGFGYMGMMLSPVHLCLLVSRDYFSAHLGLVYRRLLPCALSIMVFSIGMHVLMRLIGW